MAKKQQAHTHTFTQNTHLKTRTRTHTTRTEEEKGNTVATTCSARTNTHRINNNHHSHIHFSSSHISMYLHAHRLMRQAKERTTGTNTKHATGKRIDRQPCCYYCTQKQHSRDKTPHQRNYKQKPGYTNTRPSLACGRITKTRIHKKYGKRTCRSSSQGRGPAMSTACMTCYAHVPIRARYRLVGKALGPTETRGRQCQLTQTLVRHAHATRTNITGCTTRDTEHEIHTHTKKTPPFENKNVARAKIKTEKTARLSEVGAHYYTFRRTPS